MEIIEAIIGMLVEIFEDVGSKFVITTLNDKLDLLRSDLCKVLVIKNVI